MRIGIPAEKRPGEVCVAVTPATVYKSLAATHQLTVQFGVGLFSGDDELRN